MDFIKEEDYQKFYKFCKEITYFEVDMSDNEESSGLTRYIVRYKRRKIGILCLLELFLTEKIIRDGVFKEYLATGKKIEKTNNHGMER
ncbi:hypothetical protein [Cetobacterium somerae]